MSEQSKKEYTPQEAATLVLKKVEELLKNSKLAKANTSHEIESGGEPNNDDAEAPEHLQAGEVTKEGSFSDTEKKGSKKKKGEGSIGEADEDGDGDIDGADALEGADADGDGDLDGEDAIENKEAQTGEDLDGDDEEGESEEDESEEEEEGGDEGEGEKKKKPFGKSELPLAKFLAKRELKKGKELKGVHNAPFTHSNKTGTSEAGMYGTKANSKESVKYSKKIHEKKLNELKQMKKPNLPKSEKDVSKCGEMKLAKKQGVPKGADPAVHERCVKDVKAQGKDKSSAFAICNASGAGKKSKKKVKKTDKIEKFLGLGGTQTSGQAGTVGQGKPAAPTTGTSIADKINFGGKK